MLNRRRSAKRFTLLLLEEEEEYVYDWVVKCTWPSSVAGNWQGLPLLQGRLRLCTKSLFFEPDDIRVPIVRLPFLSIQSLEPASAVAAQNVSFDLTSTSCTKMKANLEEVPYVHEKGSSVKWTFQLLYVPLDQFLSVALELHRISRLAKLDRVSALEAFVRHREDASSFDPSGLVDFDERLVWRGPSVQLTPLVRERGWLVVSNQRVYFQPLHNISGGIPVRSHPLVGVAAVARRRSALKPIGLELFFIDASSSHLAAAAGAMTTGATASSASAGPSGQPSPSSPSSSGWQSALAELTSGPVWDQPSAFFSFRSEQDREAVLTALTSQAGFGRAAAPVHSPTLLQARGLLLEAEGIWLRRVTAAWQHGRVSNFDYLLYLNLAAGRSFNDLAQWPVFPWILRNYVSQTLDLEDPSNYRDLGKPVGALNPSRLGEYKKRFHEMSSDSFAEGALPPFLYGTHYSTPGYVMFWLVRAAPAHMLRLQNGRFDAPDRLFSSVQEAWESVNTSSTDVKELIPEFFLPQGDFLLNLQNLPLGVRQSGTAVDPVELPPWVAGVVPPGAGRGPPAAPTSSSSPSPESFLAIHRAALESPHVSRNLHRWIDLIFGSKQRGLAAVEADNVFFHLTYEGASDRLGAPRDEVELRALETQINEFGQTPTQLFDCPHPPRLVIPPTPDPALVFALPAGSTTSNKRSIPAWNQRPSPMKGSSSYPSGAIGAAPASNDDTSGNRALALALMSTILEAAAPDLTTAFDVANVDPDSGPDLDLGRAASDYRSLPIESGSPDSVSAACVGDPCPPSASGPDEPPYSAPPTSPGRSDQVRSGHGPNNPLSPVSDCGPANSRLSSLTAPFSSLLKLDKYAPSLFSLPSAAASPASPASLRPQPPPRAAPVSKPPVSARDTVPGNNQMLGGTKLSLSWGYGLPQRLHSGSAPLATLQVNNGRPVTALVLSDNYGGGDISSNGGDGGAAGRYLYCVGHGGVLRALNIRDPTRPFRSIQLEGDLLSLAALPRSSRGGRQEHPTLFTGSHNCKVHAYSVDRGHVMGSWEAHDDAVSCTSVTGLDDGAPKLVTASWDCSVKVWDLSEGRCPWGSGLAQPLIELRDIDSGVWAMAAPSCRRSSAVDGGPLSGPTCLVTGSEEGVVQTWDLRAGGRSLWAVQPEASGGDYIGGLALDPISGRFVVVASGDGALTLLDVRMMGHRLARAAPDLLPGPLRCCLTDGGLAIAGSESGALQMWDVALMTGGGSSRCGGGAFALTPDGLYEPWRPALSAGHHQQLAPINGIAVGSMGEDGGAAVLAFALEDGSIALTTA